MFTVKNRNQSVNLSPLYLEGLNLLINDGLYENQDEIIKDALRRLFNHYEINSIGNACTNNYNPPNTAKKQPMRPEPPKITPTDSPKTVHLANI